MAKDKPKKAAAPRKRKPKQESFTGMEPVEIPELTTAAEAYVEARDERMQLTERETEAQQALIAALKKHGRTVYRTPDGMLVTLVPGKDKAKVKRADEEETAEVAA